MGMETENKKQKAFSLANLGLVGGVALLLFAFALLKDHGPLPFTKSATEGRPITLDIPDGQVLGESVLGSLDEKKAAVNTNTKLTPIINIRGPVFFPRGKK